jgi:hypothetical protein
VLTRGPDEALPEPNGKAVASLAPGPGPRDISADLRRHQQAPDAAVTAPPGGYPLTVGGNPNPPADRQVNDDECDGVGVAAPGPYSLATKWVGGGANY